MNKRVFPRRKVVKAEHQWFPGSGIAVYYNCQLACGHVVLAYGMAPRGQPFGRKEAPKTCECRKCGEPQQC